MRRNPPTENRNPERERLLRYLKYRHLTTWLREIDPRNLENRVPYQVYHMKFSRQLFSGVIDPILYSMSRRHDDRKVAAVLQNMAAL